MMTIRRRLLLLLLPALALLMLAGGLVDYWIALATTQNAYDQALASTAFAAAAYVNFDQGKAAFAPSPRTAALLRAGSGVAGDSLLYAVSGPDGELIAGSPGLPAGFAPPSPAASASPESRAVFRDVHVQGVALRAVSVRVPAPQGTAIVTVAETRERRTRTQRVMLFGKLLVDFAELDITLLLIWIAVYFGLRPLAALRDEAETHSLRELRRFDESTVPGELRAVVVSFNRVLELLHDAAAAQQRFVADAAHQMRTPVAGLLAQLELLLREPRAAAVAGELATLQKGIAHLAHSANQLLSLARAEPIAALPEDLQPIELKALVEQLVERHLDRADKAGIDLGADTAPAQTLGDAWLLEDLLANLIDNALKYTPRGGHVTVRSGIEGGRPYLEVEDDGPGIAEGERTRVRERFYRLPGSVGIGCGLGLAIVDEIARVHGATLSIGSGRQGHGARMRVGFGAAAPARRL
jgi:two-component system, OmpR family, sensor histidine kinase TctE